MKTSDKGRPICQAFITLILKQYGELRLEGKSKWSSVLRIEEATGVERKTIARIVDEYEAAKEVPQVCIIVLTFQFNICLIFTIAKGSNSRQGSQFWESW